jgi:hypothetical protein
MRTKKTIITVAVMVAALAFACVATAGCAKKKEPAPPPPPPEPVATEPAVEPPPPPAVYFSPYTGLPVTDTKNINRRPLSVKIENSPASWPQSGLNAADVVYETRVEGGMSRFNCIFQSYIPEEVGPVRSARLSDAWIVPQYDALFYFSGSNSEVRSKLNSVDVTFGPGDLTHRVGFKSAPHNLYMDTKGAYKAARKKKIELDKDILPLYYGFDRTTGGAISGSAIAPIITDAAITRGAMLRLGEGQGAEDSSTSSAASSSPSAVQPLEGFTGEPAESVSLDFYSEAKWKWDADAGVWLRYTAGEKHFDGATEEQLFTDNVVVMYAEYPRASKLDPAGNPTYDTKLGGEGKAMLFRDGFVYECTWRADRNAPPTLHDAQGNMIPLKQGKTWFEVPPTSGMKVTVK